MYCELLFKHFVVVFSYDLFVIVQHILLKPEMTKIRKYILLLDIYDLYAIA